MIKISNRLKIIGDMVLKCPSINIMDVGCDHALLDIYLYQNNNKLDILATDINSKPLEHAKDNLEKYNLVDKIELQVSDGIELLNKNSTVIISGMGKDTIIEIINNKDKLKYIDSLIVSSHSKIDELRLDINKLGFKIVEEVSIFDEDKYYVVIKYVKGKEKLSNKELLLGPYLLTHKDTKVLEYYKYLLNKYNKILNSIPSNNDKRIEISKIIEFLEEEITCK